MFSEVEHDFETGWTATSEFQEEDIAFTGPDDHAARWSSTTLSAADALVATGEVARLRTRHEFDHHPPQGARTWLCFAHLGAATTAWLDGAYLGEIHTEVGPRAFEVTSIASKSDHHVLSAQLAPSASTWPRSVPPTVSLFQTGPVRLSRLRVQVTEAEPERSSLNMAAELHADQTIDASVRVTIRGASSKDDEFVTTVDRHLASGANRTQWTLPIDRHHLTSLWWPRGFGPSPLLHVDVEVLTGADGGVSDRASLTTGLRSVELDRGVLRVNGEAVFLRALRLPRGAGIEAQDLGPNINAIEAEDLLHPDAYDVADSHGLLIVQGLPAGGDARHHARLARQAIEALGSHPSIVAWSCPEPTSPVDAAGARDRATLRHTAATYDPSRPVVGPPSTPSDRRPGAFRRLISSHFGPQLRWTRVPDRDAGAIAEARGRGTSTSGGVSIADRALLTHGAMAPIALVATQSSRSSSRHTVLDVYVANDTPTAYDDVIATAAIEGTDLAWTWAGQLPPSASSYIGTIAIPHRPGHRDVVVLRLRSDDLALERSFGVAGPPHH